MESIVNYGSDEENDHTHYQYHGTKPAGQPSRREDDTNYDDVNMDMSEDSNNNESSSSSTSSGERRSRRSRSSEGISRRSRSSEGSSKSPKTSQYRSRARKSSDHDKEDYDRYPARRDRDKKLKVSKIGRRSPAGQDRHSSERTKVRQNHERRPDRRYSEKKSNYQSSERRRERQSSDRRSDRKSSECRFDRQSSEHRPDRKSSERRRDRQSTERRHDHQSSERRCDRPSSERALDRKRSSGSDSSYLKESRPAATDSPTKVPALMDLKPFGGEPPPAVGGTDEARDRNEKKPIRDRGHRDRSEEKDADSDRGDRSLDRRDPNKRHCRDKDRERNRDRHSDKRSTRHNHSRKNDDRNARTDERKFASRTHSSPPASASAGADYRHSYKVNKKLQVMEKMGLQIKTPDGSMATVQQLVQRNLPTAAPPGLPAYYNPNAVNAAKIVDQVQKRKLLWGHKDKPEVPPAAKWTGTKFAQDTDGKQASKFMRLMGIKDPAAVQAPPVSSGSDEPPQDADVLRKQEEMFQNMQAQYEVARVTTHTMRGVGLGFGQQFPRQF